MDREMGKDCHFWSSGYGCKGHPDFADARTIVRSAKFKRCSFKHDTGYLNKNVCINSTSGTCRAPECQRLHKWENGSWSTGLLHRLYLSKTLSDAEDAANWKSSGTSSIDAAADYVPKIEKQEQRSRTDVSGTAKASPRSTEQNHHQSFVSATATMRDNQSRDTGKRENRHRDTSNRDRSERASTVRLTANRTHRRGKAGMRRSPTVAARVAPPSDDSSPEIPRPNRDRVPAPAPKETKQPPQPSTDHRDEAAPSGSSSYGSYESDSEDDTRRHRTPSTERLARATETGQQVRLSGTADRAAPEKPKEHSPLSLGIPEFYSELKVIKDRLSLSTEHETLLQRLIATSDRRDWDDIQSGAHPILELFKSQSDPAGKTTTTSRRRSRQSRPDLPERSRQETTLRCRDLPKKQKEQALPQQGTGRATAMIRGDP